MTFKGPLQNKSVSFKHYPKFPLKSRTRSAILIPSLCTPIMVCGFQCFSHGFLAADVKKLLTVEYQEIHSQHHAIRTLTPKGLAEAWLGGNLPEFDFAVSFSSYEHDGLGRYGDPIDPWGDIWDVRRITCFVKPGGLLYLGVPMGPDQVIKPIACHCSAVVSMILLPPLVANTFRMSHET